MNKLWIILQREYLTRVKKKSFILVTLLTPLGIGLIAFISGYFISKAGKAEKNILVKDESGILTEETLSSTYMNYTFSEKDIETLKNTYIKEGYDILLYLDKTPAMGDKRVEMKYFSKDKLSLPTLESIERRVSGAIRSYKIELSQIDRSKLDNLETRVNLENGLGVEDETAGSKASKISTIISTALSYVMGFLMYMVIFIFGSMVMRSVMEEKINRIVEVIISSVKPFQLMLGKILGVGLVGLTQLAIWIILIFVIMTFMGSYFTPDINDPQTQQTIEAIQQASNDGNDFGNILSEFSALNWWLILPSFVVFFLGGFLIYSSLFAAIGSTISDDLGEAQQFMLPIIVPVIIAFVMIPAVFNDPDGPVAIFGSMFPLLSPILMPARLPFDPPVWQVLLSIVILIASIIFFVWLAARIYRVGIFMYGKKVSWKELSKWLFYKG